MILFTKQQQETLLENGACDDPARDFSPVAKISDLGSKAVWLISELDPEYPHIAFGLCDLGMGFPEMGSVDIREICEASFAVLNEASFTGKFPLTVYARAARAHGEIVCDENIVSQFVRIN